MGGKGSKKSPVVQGVGAYDTPPDTAGSITFDQLRDMQLQLFAKNEGTDPGLEACDEGGYPTVRLLDNVYKMNKYTTDEEILLEKGKHAIEDVKIGSGQLLCVGKKIEFWIQDWKDQWNLFEPRWYSEPSINDILQAAPSWNAPFEYPEGDHSKTYKVTLKVVKQWIHRNRCRLIRSFDPLSNSKGGMKEITDALAPILARINEIKEDNNYASQRKAAKELDDKEYPDVLVRVLESQSKPVYKTIYCKKYDRKKGYKVRTPDGDFEMKYPYEYRKDDAGEKVPYCQELVKTIFLRPCKKYYVRPTLDNERDGNYLLIYYEQNGRLRRFGYVHRKHLALWLPCPTRRRIADRPIDKLDDEIRSP